MMTASAFLKLLLPGWLLAAPLCPAASSEAEEFTRHGEYGEAARLYLLDAEQAKDNPEESFKARLNAAGCLKLSGDLCAAEEVLNVAAPILPKLNSDKARLLFLAELGSVRSLGRRSGEAVAVLKNAATLAERLGETTLLAGIQNDIGIAFGNAGLPEQAYHHYGLAQDSAEKAGLPDLRIRARQNRLVAAYSLWKRDYEELRNIREVGGLDDQAGPRLEASRGFFETALAESSQASADPAGQNPLVMFETIGAGSAAIRYGMKAQGFTLLERALAFARSHGDRMLERAALLAFAEVYFDSGRLADAGMILERLRALQPQEIEAQEAALEILAARLGMLDGTDPGRLRGRVERAVRLVESIRSDLASAQFSNDLGRSFREWSGTPYLMLAELELRAGKMDAAREAVESFKAWEIDDFYRNDCVNASLGRRRNLRQVQDPSVGLLYVIALQDRVEVLLGTAASTERRSARLTAAELDRLARVLRYRLEFDHGTFAFQSAAEELHRHLIAPLMPALKEAGIRHLVFVPDGALGTIPLGVLRDAESGRYLIEDFSISVSPSFSLMTAEKTGETATKALLAGLSTPPAGYAALPAVKEEIGALAKIYGEHSIKMDGDFTVGSFRQEVSAGQAGLIHIASHGEFKGNGGETYLLASDDKITMDDLESMIQPRKFTGTPVELLCLSACRTAAGDERAALGLAGVAVKSGAHSVAASLWYVNDASASTLMESFHRHWHRDNMPKAAALREAQLDFLRANPLAHPHFWAPFILIGDWQ